MGVAAEDEQKAGIPKARREGRNQEESDESNQSQAEGPPRVHTCKYVHSEISARPDHPLESCDPKALQEPCFVGIF